MFITACVIALITALLLVVGIRKRKKQLVAFVSAVLVIAAVSFIIYNTVLYNNSDEVTIKEIDGSDISIAVENHSIGYEYYYAQFSTDLSTDELVQALKKQYPNASYNTQTEQIEFTFDNQIFTVDKHESNSFLWCTRNKYWFENNIVAIEKDSVEYIIPFPKGLLDDSVEVISREMKISADFEAVSQHYRDFTNANISGNTITLSYEGYTVDISIVDDIVSLSISTTK